MDVARITIIQGKYEGTKELEVVLVFSIDSLSIQNRV